MTLDKLIKEYEDELKTINKSYTYNIREGSLGLAEIRVYQGEMVERFLKNLKELKRCEIENDL